MFNSIASYLFGSGEAGATQEQPIDDSPNPAPDSPKLKTRPADNEWILVEKTRTPKPSAPRAPGPDPLMECSLGPLFKSSSNPLGSSRRPRRNHDILDNSLCISQGLGYHSDDCVSDSGTVDSDLSSMPEAVVHPSMEESWLVTPPACFTADSAAQRLMETSSLENLLIEHPSMSVYSHRGRPSSTGGDSESSEPDRAAESSSVSRPRGGRQAGLARHEPPRRSTALIGLTQTQLVKSMQRSQQRQFHKDLSRSKLARSNQVREVKSTGNSRRRQAGHLQQPRRSNRNFNKQY